MSAPLSAVILVTNGGTGSIVTAITFFRKRGTSKGIVMPFPKEWTISAVENRAKNYHKFLLACKKQANGDPLLYAELVGRGRTMGAVPYTSHADCDHPKSPAARRACRRLRAEGGDES